MLKRYTYDNGSASCAAEFGNGDLLVSSIIDSNTNRTGIVIFNNQHVEPVGTLHSATKGEKVSNICRESIILNFTKIESIDIVIKYLTDAKESLNKLLKEKQNEI